jgi:hypothetical protein
MQIVVKASKDSKKDPIEVITRNVTETLGNRDEKAVVSKLFPDQISGNRARLYMVHLPDDLPDRDVSRIVERLSSHDALEYAEIPAAKRPLDHRR